MASQKNYIPRNPGEFDIFFKNIVEYVAERTRRSGPVERDSVYGDSVRRGSGADCVFWEVMRHKI